MIGRMRCAVSVWALNQGLQGGQIFGCQPVTMLTLKLKQTRRTDDDCLNLQCHFSSTILAGLQVFHRRVHDADHLLKLFVNDFDCTQQKAKGKASLIESKTLGEVPRRLGSCWRFLGTERIGSRLGSSSSPQQAATEREAGRRVVRAPSRQRAGIYQVSRLSGWSPALRRMVS